jgi:hypothetical protein
VGSEPIRKITLSDGRVRYRVVVNAGRKSDGSRAQRTSTHRTRREAREWLAAVRSDLGRGMYVAPQWATLNEHLDTWLEGKRDIRPATRRSYVDGMKPVRRMLGHKLLQDVTKADVETLVTKMLTTGGRRGHGRSPRTVTMMLVVLQQAMQDALRQGLIVRNVVSLVQKPRQVHHEMSAWTLGQTRTFLAHVGDDRLHAAWMLTMHGLRRGEVLGLRWTDLTWTDQNQHSRSGRPESWCTPASSRSASPRLPAAAASSPYRPGSSRRCAPSGTGKQPSARWPARPTRTPVSSSSTSSAGPYDWSATETPSVDMPGTPACPTSGSTTPGTRPRH